VNLSDFSIEIQKYSGSFTLAEKMLHDRDCLLLPHKAFEIILFSLGLVSSAEEVARRLILEHGDVETVASLPHSTLRQAGLTDLAIVSLRAMRTMLSEQERWDIEDRPLIDDEAALMAYLTATGGRARVHAHRVLFLSRNKRLLANRLISKGDACAAPILKREVITAALSLDAVYLYIVKEQPNSDLDISSEEADAVQELSQIASYFNMAVLDYLVCSRGKFRFYK
jgi:DNA repair protein RadC